MSGQEAASSGEAPGFAAGDRPVPASKAPPRQALRAVYEHLLSVEQERLAVAVRIERERGIVFPETSVIVRDVRTLAEKLYGPGASGEEEPPGEPPAGVAVAGAEPAAGAAGAAPGGASGGAGNVEGPELGDDAAGEVDALLAGLGDLDGEPGELGDDGGGTPG